MSDILSPEELEEAIRHEWRVDFWEPLPSEAARNAIAVAQAKMTKKALIANMESRCQHHFNANQTVPKWSCYLCWQAVKEGK